MVVVVDPHLHACLEVSLHTYLFTQSIVLIMFFVHVGEDKLDSEGKIYYLTLALYEFCDMVNGQESSLNGQIICMNKPSRMIPFYPFSILIWYAISCTCRLHISFLI